MWWRKEKRAEQPAGYPLYPLGGGGPVGASILPDPSGIQLAVERCVEGMLSRTLAAAAVTTASGRPSPFTPQLRAWAGGRLIREGEAHLIVDVDGADVRLAPAVGGVEARDGGEWGYSLSRLSPGYAESLYYPTDRVCALIWQPDPTQPWTGVGPFESTTRDLAASVSALLAREARSPHGYMSVLEMPSGVTEGQRQATSDSYAQQVGRNSGGLVTLSLSSTGREMVGGRGSGGRTDRYGFSPPAPVTDLALALDQRLLAAAGVPPSLMSESATEVRSAIRFWLSETVGPVVDRAAASLSEATGDEHTINLDPVRSPDEFVSLARAAGSLAGAGVPTLEALTMVGFDVADMSVSDGAEWISE